MTYHITNSQLLAFDGSLAKLPYLTELADGINVAAKRFGFDQTQRRLRYFVAQAAWETQIFKKFTEDLYYTTPGRLVDWWPKRFYVNVPNPNYKPGGSEPQFIKRGAGPRLADEYVRNPEKLANAVYADRLGNGSDATGDGWKFRGRGAFHLTGAANYGDASKFLYGDDRLLDNPDSVASDMIVSMETAGWFWHRNNFNALADRDEFTKMTGVINGSTQSAKDRLLYLNRANRAITG